MWPVIAMAAVAAAQQYDQQKRADRDRKLAAETQRYSPWTGNKAGPINEPGSAALNVGQGALAGYGMQQQMDSSKAAQGYNNEMLNLRKQEVANQATMGRLQQGGGWGGVQSQVGPSQGGWGMPSPMQYPQQDPNAYAQNGWMGVSRRS